MSNTTTSDPFFNLLQTLFGGPRGCDDPAKGTHRHQCPKCNHVWSHGNDCSDNPDLTNAEFDRAHSCPKCDAGVQLKYHGDGATNSEQGSCCSKKSSI